MKTVWQWLKPKPLRALRVYVVLACLLTTSWLVMCCFSSRNDDTQVLQCKYLFGDYYFTEAPQRGPKFRALGRCLAALGKSPAGPLSFTRVNAMFGAPDRVVEEQGVVCWFYRIDPGGELRIVFVGGNVMETFEEPVASPKPPTDSPP